MGITQHAHGTENVFSIANLALMTGNLGKESAGVNPLRGQNNVQGATDMGCIPNMYPGIPAGEHPGGPGEVRGPLEGEALRQGRAYRHGNASGRGKGHDQGPVHHGREPGAISDPDMAHTTKALKALDFLVVQDIFMTETAELAHVVLPASSFAEKVGTFTNTERRVQRVRRAVNSPGEAMKDSLIIMELSKRMGYEMPYHHTDEIFQRDRAGLARDGGHELRQARGRRPAVALPHAGPSGDAVPVQGRIPARQGQVHARQVQTVRELTDKDYPFLLTTGRHVVPVSHRRA